MIATDPDALLCDMAETYHIYDLESLPVDTVATLAAGLRDNSRIKLKMAGVKAPLETILMAQAVDRLGLLIWQNTRDGHKGVNRPKAITELLSEPKNQIKTDAYATPEEFWAAREAILKRGG